MNKPDFRYSGYSFVSLDLGYRTIAMDMAISSRKTGYVLFVDLCNSPTFDFWFISCRYIQQNSIKTIKKKSVGNTFDQNWRTSSLKLLVLYKNDVTKEADSKERMMSLQNLMEPDKIGSETTVWKLAKGSSTELTLLWKKGLSKETKTIILLK